MSRFFFALWPDNSTREAIIKCRSQWTISGRMTDRSNLHITVVFLGKLNINQLQNIIKQAEKIVCPNFEICLNHSGYFKNSRAAWLGLEFIPDSLIQLHRQLLEAADISHIPVTRKTYTPHVTLARKSSSLSKQIISPMVWHVNDFVLLESIDTNTGVKYQIVKRFTLT